MYLKRVYIHNFRKLNQCCIDFSSDETLFVGANNSGKTSAIHAINYFLTKDGSTKFSAEDIPVNHWKKLNANAEKWESTDGEDEHADEESMQDFISLLPLMRITLHVEENERFLIKEIIPDLSWNSTELSVAIRMEPKDWHKLKADFKEAKAKSLSLYGDADGIGIQMLSDFLKRARFTKHLALKFYAWDPDVPNFNADSLLTESAVTQLFLIHIIEAQRGFSDVYDTISQKYASLSGQFSSYIHAHTDPDILSEKDKEIIESIQKANDDINKKLQERYHYCLSALNKLNYPGFLNPQISLKTGIGFENLLNPSTAVHFSVPCATGSHESDYVLPERYNGLGYRNLISITLELLDFRETWEKRFSSSNDDDREAAPIHLVLLEEPEAHLHVQAQKTFIRQALGILRQKQENGYQIPAFATTQLIVSTHSGHIAYNHDFEKIRYFAKKVIENIPFSNVISLAEAYKTDTGSPHQELKTFVSKYLKLSYYDVFFADAVILVEGKAERILMLHFLKEAELESKYITLLEVDGSYAHIFIPLLEKLSIPCLIITDIDSAAPSSDSDKYKKAYTSLSEGKISLNSTLKKWFSVENELPIDFLLECSEEQKKKNLIRLCYQIGIPCGNNGALYYPYTFEDAVAYTNKATLTTTENNFLGMTKKLVNILKTTASAPQDCAKKMFEEIKSNGKSDFAMQLFKHAQTAPLTTPNYIAEGLQWLHNMLTPNTHHEDIQ